MAINQLYVDVIDQQRSNKSIKKIVKSQLSQQCGLNVWRCTEKNCLDYSWTIKTEYLLIKLLPLPGAGTKTGVVLCGLSNDCNDSIHS